MPNPNSGVADGHVRELARAGFRQLADALRDLAMAPDAVVTQRHLDAFKATLIAFEACAQAPNTNGSLEYRLREVSEHALKDHAAAKHGLRMLQRLHGPQEATFAGPCDLPVTVWDPDRCIRPERHDGDHICETGLRLPLNAEVLRTPRAKMSPAEVEGVL